MISLDEDALICDLAETYQIYDYRKLPPKQVAIFAYGLRENSRIKMLMSGEIVSSDTILSAFTVDALNTLIWMNSSGGKRPKSIADVLLSGNKNKDSSISSFANMESFNAAKNKILGGAK